MITACIAMLASAATAAGLQGYSIVRPAGLSAPDAFVLEDFRGLLSRGLGGEETPVCEPDAAPTAKRVFFGIPSPGLDTASLRNQEHVVDVRDGDVYLFGGGTNGTRYAAYAFLQGVLGYRFFDMRGGVRVPDLKAVALTNCVRRRMFSFENRYTTIFYKEAKGGDTDNLSEASDENETIEEELDWVAFRNQFFSVALISKDNFARNANLISTLDQKGTGYLKQFDA